MRRAANNHRLQIVRPPAALPEKRAAAIATIRELRLRLDAVAVWRRVLVFAATGILGACEPTVTVGQWTCPATTADAGAVPSDGDPISIPWSTGFESRDCDYTQSGGFCFHTGPASVSYVTSSSPTHGGHFSAAFTALGDDKNNVGQVRCVRQGVLPLEAYYGAWYYIPATASNSHLWNLIHFQGNDSPTATQPAKGIVDVDLANGPNGELNLVLFLFLHGPAKTASIAVPIGSWFHIELYLKRRNDNAGAVILYQDGVRVLDFTGMSTDPTSWAQWYVGNLADALSPPNSTLYVDDVTIAATQGWSPPP